MRKEQKYHYIYKTTNIITKRYYIGMHSTNNLNDGYFGSGKRLRYSINKYGKENHIVEILEFYSSRDELKIKEKEIVNLNEISKIECLNLIVGGEGGRGFTSKEQKMNAIKSNRKQKWLRENDKEWSDRRIKQLKENGSIILKKAWSEGKLKPFDWTGKTHKKETKKKISKSKKGTGIGSSNSQFGTCWITNGVENKKIKKDELHLYSEWRLGRI